MVGGELVVTGRLKEMLIVHGRNLFPQDLEQEARAAHSALTGLRGAAFGVAVPDERVVVVHEVGATVDAAKLEEIADAVKRQLTDLLGAPAQNLLLVNRGIVRRTTSGKIQRVAMRKLFLVGALPARHIELEPAVAELLTTRAVPATAPVEAAL